MNIRRAVSSDLDELVRLRLAAVVEADPACGISAELPTATRNYLLLHVPLADPFICWVADSEGRVVATASVILLRRMPNLKNLTGLEGYVSNVYTEPAHRRTGIATALIRTMVKESANLGIKRLWLYSTDTSEGIYRSIGFHRVERSTPEMDLFTTYISN